MTSETIQSRVHDGPAEPTLIHLPGLHGDWTLVSTFRAALQGRARFVEFTYPRTTSWSLEDYARAIIAELHRHEITSGWLLGESFSSQVAWKMIELTKADGPLAKAFQPSGLVLCGGFIRHPIIWGVHFLRHCNRLTPAWMMRLLLRIYANYARLRHRKAPETAACIEEFVARRTEPDRQAMLHRYVLIAGNDLRPIARCCALSVFQLSGFIEPVVPWPVVRSWLRKNCPGFRASRVIINADHNVLGTAPEESAKQILQWIQSTAERT
jgi:hypothetical protein